MPHRQRQSALLALFLCLAAAGTARAASRPRVAWTYETLGAVWARPLVGADGRIFIGSEDGFFYAFAPGGGLAWTYKASEGFGGWPSLVDGQLAAGSRNGKLYFFSLDGELAGTVVLGGPASGPSARLGKLLLVPTSNGNLVAVRDRALLWSHPAGSPLSGWPVAAPGGKRVYAGCADGSVLALDAQGRRLWRVSIGGPVANGLVPLGRGLLVATTAGEVVSLDERGTVRWRRRLEATESGLAPLGGGDGALLAGLGGHLIALDDRGAVRWKLEADGPIRSLPSAAGDRILFGTERGSLFVVDRRGAPLGLLQAGGPVRGGIAAAAGRLLFGAQDRRLYVLPDPTRPAPREPATWREALRRAARGELLWRRDLSGPIARGVAAGAAGRLIAATQGKRVFTLETDGRVRWSYSCGEDIDTLPAAGPAGELYFGCGDGGFYALRPDGEMRYRFPVNKALASSPALARDGTVYFGAADKRFYALDAAGKPHWRLLTGDEIESAPRIAPDGMVYVGSDDRHLYAVSAEGAARWTYQTGGQILSSPLVGPDGTVYFGSRDHFFYAVSAAGKLRWRFETGGEIDSDPALTAAGDVAFGSDDGNLYLLSGAGALRWHFPAGAEIRGALVPRGDGSIVFGTMAGSVLAVGAPGKNPPASPPGVLARTSLGRGRVGPALLAGPELVIAGADGVVRALGADRFPSWSVRVGETALGQPAPQGDTFYVTDGSGNLVALSERGLRFKLRLDRQRLSDPALIADEAGEPLILAGSAAGRLWAVTPEGKVRWFHSGAWPVSAAPLPFADGSRRIAVAETPDLVILDSAGQQRAVLRLPGLRAGPVGLGGLAVAGDGRGRLFGIGSDGKQRWRRDLGAGVRSIRALAESASVVVLTEDGRAWRVAADGQLLGSAAGSAPYRAAGPTGGLDVLLAQADHSLWRLDGRTGLRRRLLELPDAPVAMLRDGVGNAERRSDVIITADGLVTWLEGKP